MQDLCGFHQVNPLGVPLLDEQSTKELATASDHGGLMLSQSN